MIRIQHDGPLIIGGGLAGLSAALEAAPAKVLVVSPAPLLQSASSAWAQGGVAAALSAKDAPALHLKDTEAAGAGLVDHHAAEVLTDDGGRRWSGWRRWARRSTARPTAASPCRARRPTPWRGWPGSAATARAGRSCRRWSPRCGRPHIEVWEDGRLRGLLQDATGRVVGALIERHDTELWRWWRPAVVLATGGAGGLYGATTTPAALLGEGLALAYKAGAEVLDPEFMQFHPTAIDVGLDPMPLATEALRGEGARLIDKDGVFILGPADDADLAPRDVVARAVHRARAEGRGAFLDATKAIGEHFPKEFPAVFASCMAAGLDPRTTPIPVAPAAHYYMGGITADPDGRTTLPGLFAVGECAATGVHGANRLASNSLLEAAAFGRRTGRSAAAEAAVSGEVATVVGRSRI
jgi:L-aspartate oxidase